MRAAVLEEAGSPLVIRDDITIEEPRFGEVAVSVKHCGVCHSDVSLATGTFPVALPVILGHEAAGIVEAVGPGVTNVAPGDHVVLTPCAPCGTCAWCVRGEWTLCVNADAMMTSAHPDGGTRLSRNGEVVHRGVGVAAFAESVIIQATGAVKIPADVPLDVACVIGCAVQTGVGAVLNTAGVGEGDSVLVMGLGGIGQSIVQGARLAGASQIIVSDPNEQRRATARKLGATHAIDPTTEDVATLVMDVTAGNIGIDWAFDAVGSSALINTGVDVCRKGGTTVMVGVPAMDDPLVFPLAAGMAVMEKKLIGCVLGGCNSLRDIPRFIALAQAGRLDLESLITGRRDLADINLAFDDILSTTGIRTVIDL